jgi:hypothetical protein
MSIVLIGGIDRLSAQYQKEAKLQGMELQIFSQAKQGMNLKIKSADAVVIFTNKISHHARNQAFTAAQNNGIPVYMHHACGVCTLRQCLKCVQIINSPVIDS